MTTRIIHRLRLVDTPDSLDETWQDLNPGWEIRDWGEESVLFFEEIHSAVNSLYEKAEGDFDRAFYANLIPLLGYAIVRNFGGVFVGEGYRPISLPDYSDTAWYAYPDVFGSSISNDPFWTVVLNEITHGSLKEDYSTPGFIDQVSKSMPGFLAVLKTVYEPSFS